MPKVYAWSSRADTKSVGAEYIVMEKAKGEPLDRYFDKMDVADRFEVLKEIARYQLQWLSTPFSGYGGLYFSSDLEDSEKVILAPTGQHGNNNIEGFVIGPTVGRQWVDDGRLLVDFNRGPCKLFILLVAITLVKLDRDEG